MILCTDPYMAQINRLHRFNQWRGQYYTEQSNTHHSGFMSKSDPSEVKTKTVLVHYLPSEHILHVVYT